MPALPKCRDCDRDAFLLHADVAFCGRCFEGAGGVL